MATCTLGKRRIRYAMPEARTALLVGATGLIGGHCLDLLLARPEYTRVTVLVRRPLGRQHVKLVEHVVDFEQLEAQADQVVGDDIFACLGTTIKVAGSQARFRWVDHDCTVTVARLAHSAGARGIALVSSVGAAVNASSFYLRVKGETERDVNAIAFETVEVFRPSLLLGNRKESRPGEALAIAVGRPLAFFMAGPLKPYRPVEARRVAAAMVTAMLRREPGMRVRHYVDIVSLSA